MTYRELIYAIRDELKINSDDSDVSNEYIIFLCSKYRSYILKTEKLNKKLLELISPTSPLYQTLCLDLEETNRTENEYSCDGGTLLRSIQEIPNIIESVGDVFIDTYNQFKSIRIAYITPQRMKFVGHNKWLKNIIYATIGNDKHLYLDSSNPAFKMLSKIKMTAIFEDEDTASELSCDDNDACDNMDKKYPIEDSMVAYLIQSVVKELLGIIYRPKDENNNSKDDLSTIGLQQQQQNEQKE